MSLRAVTEVVRPLSFVSCLVRGEHTGSDLVVLDPVAAPSETGGTGPAGGRPDFPSPTKIERNGLTGAELGAQKFT